MQLVPTKDEINYLLTPTQRHSKAAHSKKKKKKKKKKRVEILDFQLICHLHSGKK